MICKKIIFTVLICLLHSFVFAQENPEWKSVFRQINTEVQTHSKAYSTLKTATETIGHRLTGSKNGRLAEEYAFQLLKSYGFSDVRYQPFTVESWSRGNISLQVGTGGKKLQPIKAVSLAHSPVKVSLTAPLVDMGNGVETDYLSKPGAVKGKIALVYLHTLPGSAPGTPKLHRSEKTALATKYGAKGIILINSVEGGVLLTGTASVTGKLIPIPAVCIGKEDGMKIKVQLNNNTLQAAIAMTNNSGIIHARNVIATLTGKSLPEEKIVIGGHLDSWDLATGAIDNGIGSFSILDMARTFKVLKLQPKRSIEFILFMGEEQGLLGSKAYIKEAVKNNTIRQISFMLNYDMTNDPTGFHASTESSQALFKNIGAIAAQIDTTFKNTFSYQVNLHSDHQPFMLQGIPTGGSIGGSLPNNSGRCYHADCDLFDLVDEKGMKNTVRFSSMLLYGLSDTPALKTRHRTETEIRNFLIKNNLKEPLKIAGEWRWPD